MNLRSQTRSILVSSFAAAAIAFSAGSANAAPNLNPQCGGEKGSETKKPQDPKNPSVLADTQCDGEKGSETKKPKDPKNPSVLADTQCGGDKGNETKKPKDPA
jgi:hypothetical protein